jgi:hypothetical protein
MEIGTGLTILGSAVGGKDIILKMLGPTADYLGEGVKDFTKKRLETFKDILANASKKLGKKLEESEGSVSPKVLKGIINDGTYCDDFLSIDYFGGVLASSRSGISRDDRGAYFNALISRLSTYQLRIHYIIFHIVKELYDGEEINIGIKSNRQKLRVYIPLSTFIEAMDFEKAELSELGNIANHAIFGLAKEDLIGDGFRYGDKDQIKKTMPEENESGFILEPSPLGVELFLWAYGEGQTNINDFFSKSKTFDVDEKIKLSGRKTKGR